MIRKDICTPMFITALLTIVKTWKQPRYAQPLVKAFGDREAAWTGQGLQPRSQLSHQRRAVPLGAAELSPAWLAPCLPQR